MRFGLLAAAAIGLAHPVLAQDAAPAIAPGTITVEPLGEAAGEPAVREAFGEAVSGALSERGFLPLPGAGGGRYVARLTLTRTPQGEVAVKGKALDPSASVGNWGAGASLAIGGKPESRQLMVTELAIVIAPRAGGEPVWRGRAVTVKAEGTKDDAAGVLAPRLAAAAMRSFPETREEPTPVP